MLLFIQIVFIVYILAVNVYGFILVYTKHNENLESPDCKEQNNGNGKFIITALLGGSLGVFIAMFVYKYRLDNLVLMVFLPVIAVINFFIIWEIYSNNFGFVRDVPYITGSILFLEPLFNYTV